MVVAWLKKWWKILVLVVATGVVVATIFIIRGRTTMIAEKISETHELIEKYQQQYQESYLQYRTEKEKLEMLKRKRDALRHVNDE
jgi:uncharacterized membrane protein (DUF106 family)